MHPPLTTRFATTTTTTITTTVTMPMSPMIVTGSTAPRTPSRPKRSTPRIDDSGDDDHGDLKKGASS